MRANIDGKADGLAAAVSRRRATPSFKPDPVPEELLNDLLETATMAPSGYNLQPWRFIVVRDAESRRRLRAAALGQPKVEQAPVMIIACGDRLGWRDGDLDRVLSDGKTTGYIKDEKMAEGIRRNARQYLESTDIDVWVTRQTMIAFTFLLLAAEMRGLDTAPMEGFDEAKVREAFAIPSTARVIALMAIGYGQPPDKPYGGRFPLDRVVFDDRYGAPWRPRAAARGR